MATALLLAAQPMPALAVQTEDQYLFTVRKLVMQPSGIL